MISQISRRDRQGELEVQYTVKCSSIVRHVTIQEIAQLDQWGRQDVRRTRAFKHLRKPLAQPIPPEFTYKMGGLDKDGALGPMTGKRTGYVRRGCHVEKRQLKSFILLGWRGDNQPRPDAIGYIGSQVP